MGIPALPHFRRARAAGLAAVLAAALLPAGAASQEAAYGPVAGPVASEQPGERPAGLPSSLAELADRALSNNPQVIASRAALAASQADLDAARWLRYPSLSAEALAATGGSNAADIDGFAVNVALEQPIWAGGTINSQIDAARSQRDAGAEGLREARFGVLAGIIEAWFGVVRADQRAAALEAGIADHRALVASIERRVAAEVSPLADLTLARSRTTQLEIELAAVREAGANALVRLGELAGDVPQAPVLPDAAIIDAVPPEPIAFDEMIACAPALARLRSQIAAAEAEVRGAKGAVLFQLASIIDGIDGEIARATFRSSARGAALDSGVDAATNLGFLLGLVGNLWHDGRGEEAAIGLAGLVLLLAGMTALGLSARTRGEPLNFDGAKRLLDERPHVLKRWLRYVTMRDFYCLFLALMIAAGLVWHALAIFTGAAALWLVTVIALLLRARRSA